MTTKHLLKVSLSFDGPCDVNERNSRVEAAMGNLIHNGGLSGDDDTLIEHELSCAATETGEDLEYQAHAVICYDDGTWAQEFYVCSPCWSEDEMRARVMDEAGDATWFFIHAILLADDPYWDQFTEQGIEFQLL